MKVNKRLTAVMIISMLVSSMFVMAFIPLNRGQEVKKELYSSIVWVESKGNSFATTADGSAGTVQIRPIMVREVNRILKIKGSDKRYTLQDRFNDLKSREMFWIYQNFYHPNIDWDHISLVELERMARRWNGGPDGDKKPSTIKYWHKVLKRLKKAFPNSTTVTSM